MQLAETRWSFSLVRDYRRANQFLIERKHRPGIYRSHDASCICSCDQRTRRQSTKPRGGKIAFCHRYFPFSSFSSDRSVAPRHLVPVVRVWIILEITCVEFLMSDLSTVHFLLLVCSGEKKLEERERENSHLCDEEFSRKSTSMSDKISRLYRIELLPSISRKTNVREKGARKEEWKMQRRIIDFPKFRLTRHE